MKVIRQHLLIVHYIVQLLVLIKKRRKLVGNWKKIDCVTKHTHAVSDALCDAPPPATRAPQSVETTTTRDDDSDDDVVVAKSFSFVLKVVVSAADKVAAKVV